MLRRINSTRIRFYSRQSCIEYENLCTTSASSGVDIKSTQITCNRKWAKMSSVALPLKCKRNLTKIYGSNNQTRCIEYAGS